MARSSASFNASCRALSASCCALNLGCNTLALGLDLSRAAVRREPRRMRPGPTFSLGISMLGTRRPPWPCPRGYMAVRAGPGFALVGWSWYSGAQVPVLVRCRRHACV